MKTIKAKIPHYFPKISAILLLEMMIKWFHLTFFVYTLTFPKSNILSILVKDYRYNDDECSRKIFKPAEKFLDLIFLI